MANKGTKTTQKKIPMRQCLGCSQHKSKKEMLRVLRTPEGEIMLDFTGKKSGRGAYICKRLDCFKKARGKKRLEASLEVKIPDEVYARLEEELALGN